MDPAKYLNNINGFINAFKRKYDKVIAGYSFKTNYVPALCNIVKEEGCFDCPQRHSYPASLFWDNSK